MTLNQETLDTLLAIKDLSAPAFRTAVTVLAFHPGERELAYISADDVAAMLDMSTKSADRHLSECVSRGALTIVDGAGDEHVCYGLPAVK